MSDTLHLKSANKADGGKKTAARTPVRGRNRNNHSVTAHPAHPVDAKKTTQSAGKTSSARTSSKPKSDFSAKRPMGNSPRRDGTGISRDDRNRTDRPRDGRTRDDKNRAQSSRSDRSYAAKPRDDRNRDDRNRSDKGRSDARVAKSGYAKNEAKPAAKRDHRVPRFESSGGQTVRKSTEDKSSSSERKFSKPKTDFAAKRPTAHAPMRHGKVRDGVREVKNGHVVRDVRDTRAVRDYKKPSERVAKTENPSGQFASGKKNQSDGVRLSKYLADQGLCSRREADNYIERGWVTVNGQRAQLGQRMQPTDRVQLARQASRVQSERVTIIINKPMGYVSGQAEDGYEPAVTLVNAESQWQDAPFIQTFSTQHLRGLAPAGRLDIDSVGLLVLTQDGRVARQLIGEESEVDKEYLVRVEGELAENGLALLNHGLELDGVPLRPAQVSWQNDDQLRFVLREGKKRQIRRMCELVGLKVVGLKRIRIGRVLLGNLPTGQWRYLAADEGFV